MTQPALLSAHEGLVTIDGRDYYAIPDIDQMAPFLVSVVSDGDRWAFASSAGPLTAGRGTAAQALFRYETDDRLHESVGSIGPLTAVRVDGALWRPLRGRHAVERRLLKSVVGDALVFEERHPTTGLTFHSRWASCERFGFVRTVTLANRSGQQRRVELIDGLVDVLPYGLEPAIYQRLRNLTNAYKRSELIDDDTRLAVYTLESPVSDRPEPQEVLRATVVWSIGLPGGSVSLTAAAGDAFEDGHELPPQALVTGRPGSYLVRASLVLEPGEETTWYIVADVARDQSDVAALRSLLRGGRDLDHEIEAAVRKSGDRLVSIMARADAQQCTADQVACAHHFSNVTYNVMRGGVPLDGYRVGSQQFESFVGRRDRRVAARNAAWFAGLPDAVDRPGLLERAAAAGDPHLLRLAREYLPFSFSRRHGDPSRPWNAFSIRVEDAHGQPVIRYEGNWRDVFQNWEALCASFPEYLPGAVTLFVDASTADGHNPYRITSDGIDWEVPDPEDPWSNIGYWGDHQLVYLLRLIDATERYLPGTIVELLGERGFTYADVPYRLAPYGELVSDPKSTIRFDTDAEAAAEARTVAIGSDGKLLVDQAGELVLATFLEKLLVATLAKLSNFVPGGGIWMNTQRPEWNDANNALVGYGLSMVTLYHLRQFLGRLRWLVERGPADTPVSTEVAVWLAAVSESLRDTPVRPADSSDAAADHHRRALMDRLGAAYGEYRATVYDAGLSGTLVHVARHEVLDLCDVALAHLDETVRGSRRPDGLYHTYNLIRFSPDGSSAAVGHLPEMLEGQVAVLGSGVLDAEQQADLIEALFESAMYRPDQRSFMLYPVRHLPSFLDKNLLPAAAVQENALLVGLLAAGDGSIVRSDLDGTHRFHPDLTDERRLDVALDGVAADSRWSSLVEQHRAHTLALYEQVFAHRSFLGRSGSMYAYEGIGSIYWHMVTKLLLAVEEAVVGAVGSDAPRGAVERLVDAYWRIRDGLGVNKTAREFGAVPIDPYSHTPAHAGAQQPGMTGAVKEELLARGLELGVRIDEGELVFDTVLLRREELLTELTRWSFVAADGSARECELGEGSVGLTVCQVPIVLTLTGGDPHVEIEFADGRTERRPGRRAGRDISQMVFGRTNQVNMIRASL